MMVGVMGTGKDVRTKEMLTLLTEGCKKTGYVKLMFFSVLE
jgi:hypothetical protein